MLLAANINLNDLLDSLGTAPTPLLVFFTFGRVAFTAQVAMRARGKDDVPGLPLAFRARIRFNLDLFDTFSLDRWCVLNLMSLILLPESLIVNVYDGISEAT